MTDRMFDHLNLPPLAEVRVEVYITGGISVKREAQGSVDSLPEMAAKVSAEVIAAATAADEALHAPASGDSGGDQ